MGGFTSKSEAKVQPDSTGNKYNNNHNNNNKESQSPAPQKNNNCKPPPPGALGTQGRGMSVSRLNLGKDLSDSDGEEGKLSKQGSTINELNNNNNTNSTSNNPRTGPTATDAFATKPVSSEVKGKEMGYWYFDIGASMKNRSWRIMEIGNGSKYIFIEYLLLYLPDV